MAALMEQLVTIHELTAERTPWESNAHAFPQGSWWESRAVRVSGLKSPEPSFTKLFTHETWAYYTGRPPLQRWCSIILTWRYSTIFNNVLPLALIAGLSTALLVGLLPPMIFPRVNPFPLSLQGTAIGLLLVFRTNNSYQRLSEAREQWSRAIVLCRSVARGVVIAATQGGYGLHQTSALKVCRYSALTFTRTYGLHASVIVCAAPTSSCELSASTRFLR